MFLLPCIVSPSGQRHDSIQSSGRDGVAARLIRTLLATLWGYNNGTAVSSEVRESLRMGVGRGRFSCVMKGV
jgi:hypothetical protein